MLTHRWPRLLACAVLFGVLAPAPATSQAPSEPLSLERALELARENNPAYLAARNDRDVADWDVRAAYARWAPSLSASSGISWQGAGSQRLGSITLDELGFGGQPSYYFSSYNLGLSYQIDGRTLLGPRQARVSRAATDAQIEAQRVALDANVTRAYLEALRQRDGVDLAVQQLERSRFNLRLVEGQLEVGTASPLDVRQAEVQVGRSEVGLLQAETAARTARLRLLQQIGIPLDRAVSLSTTFDLREPSWNAGDLLQRALVNNPTLAGRQRSVDAADVGVSVAKTSYLPTLSMSAGISGFTRRASNTGFLIAQGEAQVAGQIQNCEFTNELYRRLADPLPLQDCSRFVFTDEDRARIVSSNSRFPFDFDRNPPSAGLTLSVPIFQGLSRQRELEAARVQADDARLQLREQELALEADVTIQLDQVQTAFQSAELERRNQALADEQLRLARERYQLGFIPFLDLVEAETVKVQADRDLLNAVYAYHDALTSLEAVVGAPLRTSN